MEAPSGEGRGFAVKALLALGGYYSRESSNMRAAKLLYTAVTEQASNPQFLQGEWLAGVAGGLAECVGSLGGCND